MVRITPRRPSPSTLVNVTSKLLLIDGHSMAFRAFYALPVDKFSTSPSNSEQASSGSDPSLGGQSGDSESSSNAQSTAENATDTSSGGIRGTDGVNGSTMHLPFNLDYTKVPVLGSYNSAQRGTSE